MRGKLLSKTVEDLLAKYPNCRDSDLDLIIGVLQVSGADLSERQREIIRSINFESIRRTRQKFQENGKYLPSLEVGRQRRLKSMIVQQQAPGANPERIQTLIEEQPEPMKQPQAISWLND